MIYLMTFGVLLFPLSFPGIPTFFKKNIKPILALIIPFFIFFSLVILATWIAFPINSRFWTIPMKILSYSAIVYTGISLPFSIKFWIKHKNILFYIISIILLIFISRYFWHASIVFYDTLQYMIIEQQSYLGNKLLSIDFTNYYILGDGIYQFIGVFSSVISYRVLEMHVVFCTIFITMLISIFIMYAIDEIKINQYAIYIFILLFLLSPTELIIYLGTSYTLFFLFGPLFIFLLMKKNYDKTDCWLYILTMALACTFSSSFTFYLLLFFFLAIKIQSNIMTIFLSIITLEYGIIISWEYALFSIFIFLYPFLIRTTLISNAIRMIDIKINGILFVKIMSFLLIITFVILLIFYIEFNLHTLVPNIHDIRGWMTSVFGFGLQYFNLNSFIIIILMTPIVLYLIFHNKKLNLMMILFIVILFIMSYAFYIQISYYGVTNYNVFIYRLYYSFPLAQQATVICFLLTFLIFKIKHSVPKLISGYKYLLPITPLIILSPCFTVNIHYFGKDNIAEKEIAEKITEKTLFMTHVDNLLLTVFDSKVVPIFYSSNIFNAYDYAFLEERNSDPTNIIKVFDKAKEAIDSNTQKQYQLNYIKEKIIPGIMAYYSTDLYKKFPEYQKTFNKFIDENVDTIIMDNSARNEDVIQQIHFNTTPKLSTWIGEVYGK